MTSLSHYLTVLVSIGETGYLSSLSRRQGYIAVCLCRVSLKMFGKKPQIRKRNVYLNLSNVSSSQYREVCLCSRILSSSSSS